MTLVWGKISDIAQSQQGFDTILRYLACLATRKSCDTTKQSVSGCSHNLKLFERIEHSGIRYGIKCKQTNAAAAATYNSLADVVRLLTERSDTKSNEKLGGFRFQLQASYVSSHTEEL